MLAPYDRHMGITVARHGPDEAVLEMQATPGLANPNGVLHGGAIAGLADAAMGLAASSRLPPGRTCTNMDLHMRFLAPVRDGTLAATARVVKAGRRTLVMSADIHQGKRHIAAASSTFLYLPRSEDDREGNTQTQ